MIKFSLFIFCIYTQSNCDFGKFPMAVEKKAPLNLWCEALNSAL